MVLKKNDIRIINLITCNFEYKVKKIGYNFFNFKRVYIKSLRWWFITVVRILGYNRNEGYIDYNYSENFRLIYFASNETKQPVLDFLKLKFIFDINRLI